MGAQAARRDGELSRREFLQLLRLTCKITPSDVSDEHVFSLHKALLKPGRKQVNILDFMGFATQDRQTVLHLKNIIEQANRKMIKIHRLDRKVLEKIKLKIRESLLRPESFRPSVIGLPQHVTDLSSRLSLDQFKHAIRHVFWVRDNLVSEFQVVMLFNELVGKQAPSSEAPAVKLQLLLDWASTEDRSQSPPGSPSTAKAGASAAALRGMAKNLGDRGAPPLNPMKLNTMARPPLTPRTPQSEALLEPGKEARSPRREASSPSPDKISSPFENEQPARPRNEHKARTPPQNAQPAIKKRTPGTAQEQLNEITKSVDKEMTKYRHMLTSADASIKELQGALRKCNFDEEGDDDAIDRKQLLVDQVRDHIKDNLLPVVVDIADLQPKNEAHAVFVETVWQQVAEVSST